MKCLLNDYDKKATLIRLELNKLPGLNLVNVCKEILVASSEFRVYSVGVRSMWQKVPLVSNGLMNFTQLVMSQNLHEPSKLKRNGSWCLFSISDLIWAAPKGNEHFANAQEPKEQKLWKNLVTLKHN